MAPQRFELSARERGVGVWTFLRGTLDNPLLCGTTVGGVIFVGGVVVEEGGTMSSSVLGDGEL